MRHVNTGGQSGGPDPEPARRARDSAERKGAETSREHVGGLGLTVDDAFFLGGLNKAPFLNRMQPDIFFDDQMGNLDRYTLSIPSVHIPFGAHNGE